MKTKTEVSHTPTPWTEDKVDGKSIIRRNSEWIATMEMGKNQQTCEANAAFIVKAVNAFEAMKVALEAVKRGTEPYDGYIMTMVNQAIAKADGK